MNRTKYQGVAEIVRYNREFYLLILAGAVAASVVSFFLPFTFRMVVLAGTGTATLWIFVSLVVSHYVYDRSRLYSLDWLTIQPKYWLNIHAGLDQMTPLLRDKLMSSNFAVFDIFDPEQMTESSIRRARELSGVSDVRTTSWESLPAESEAFDAVFLIFSAHELRNSAARHTFFREVARVLKPGGSVVLVEHLRNFENFLAYGPGCLHFHSRRTWAAAFKAASLIVQSEHTVTPFVHVFELGHA